MKPIELYLSIAKEYFDTRDKKHCLFGDFAILDTREREVIYNEIEDKENEIEKYFNNDLNIDIYNIDCRIQQKVIGLMNKYFYKKILPKIQLLNITDKDIFDDSNNYNEYMKYLICLEVYNKYCKHQIKLKNNI